MKTLRTGLFAMALCSALASAAGHAQAEPHGRGQHFGQAQRGVVAHGGGFQSSGWGHGHGFRGHGGGGGWVAPLLGAAIVGGAIYATLPQPPVVFQQPPVVYPQQPVVVTDPARVRYFCAAYQQYYPHVNQCPSPWQVVTF